MFVTYSNCISSTKLKIMLYTKRLFMTCLIWKSNIEKCFIRSSEHLSKRSHSLRIFESQTRIVTNLVASWCMIKAELYIMTNDSLQTLNTSKRIFESCSQRLKIESMKFWTTNWVSKMINSFNNLNDQFVDSLSIRHINLNYFSNNLSKSFQNSKTCEFINSSNLFFDISKHHQINDILSIHIFINIFNDMNLHINIKMLIFITILLSIHIMINFSLNRFHRLIIFW